MKQTFADPGHQNTWEVSRAHPGTAGILGDYSGSKVGRRSFRRTHLGRLPGYPNGGVGTGERAANELITALR